MMEFLFIKYGMNMWEWPWHEWFPKKEKLCRKKGHTHVRSMGGRYWLCLTDGGKAAPSPVVRHIKAKI